MRLNRSPRRSTTLVSALLIAGVAVAGCSRGGGAGGGGGDEETATIKFSHVVTPNTPKGKAAEKFKEIVEEESGGDITVEIFPNSELYGDEDELQALQSGAVQMLAPSSAKFTTIAPQLQVLDLPFLFDSVEDIPEVVSPDSVVGKAIYENEELADRDMQVLGLWDNGLKQLSSNDTMKKPADLKGLRFRIQPSDVLRTQFQKWTAQTTPMAFAEVYSALQQGVIDGQENPYSNIESQNMHTVQSDITESNHGYVGYILVINKKFLDGLTEDQQKIVTDAADEASAYNREVAVQTNEDAKQVILDAGETTITELSDAERQAFKDAVVPSVWEQYADVVGQDLLDELLA
ncbi:MAG: DctP family TRAP transporter solute-binding subunit, partial [Nocardioidaceae bacterium]